MKLSKFKLPPTTTMIAIFIVGLVIVKDAKPYNIDKLAAEDVDDNELDNQAGSATAQVVEPSPISPSPDGGQREEQSGWSSSQQQQQQQQQQPQQPTPRSRWGDHSSRSGSFEGGDDRNCPLNYEEIIGYCADSPIGNPLAFNRFRCSAQCNLNPDCLGFSFDKEADGKSRPFTCTLQSTDCRFPTYSTRFGFCRKRIDKPMHHKAPFSHHHHSVAAGAPMPPVSPYEMPPFDVPPIRISEEPNTEILRAYLSTYDQICDSDKQFKTTTVFTCAQYCIADAGCQAFSYEQSHHVCRFIGHCQQKQVFKKLFGSSGMPDILSLLNFILARASMPTGFLGSGLPPSILAAAAAAGSPFLSQRPPLMSPPPYNIMPSMMPPMMPPYKSEYTSSEERYLMGRGVQHHHRHGRHDADRSSDSDDRRLLQGYERLEGDCQSPLLENKIYELNAYECARKCHRRPDCAGFSVNLYVTSPRECYLRADSCSSPTTSNAWVYFRKMERLRLMAPSPSPRSAATAHKEEQPPPSPSSPPAPAPPSSSSPPSQPRSENFFSYYEYPQQQRNSNNNKSAPSVHYPGFAETMQSRLQPARKISSNIGYANQLPPMMTIARRSLTSPTSSSNSAAESATAAGAPRSREQMIAMVMPPGSGGIGSSSDSAKAKQESKVLEYFTQMPGNCRGNVIKEFEGTLGECAVRCIHTTKCLGFAYSQWDRKCFIKSNRCLNPEPSPNGIVYYQLRM